MKPLYAALLVSLALPAAAQTTDIAGPQPTLKTEPVVIVGHDGQRHRFTVEVARTPHEQEVGLMYRTVIPPTSGMIFNWESPREAQMWMKHCPVPEDMLFIRADGTIGHIAENTVPQSEAIIDGRIVASATLELAGGVTAADNIRVGDKVLAAEFGDAP